MKRIIITIPEKEKEYAIVVGKDLLSSIFSQMTYDRYTKIVIVTDEHIQKLWLPALIHGFTIKPHIVVLPAGEKHKTIETIQIIWKELQLFGCDRKSLVITFGGGVIGDMGGFAAST